MTLTERIRRTQITLGVTGVVLGLVGLIRAGDVAFGADVGAQITWPSYEINLMTYNRLGAIVTLLLAAIGLAAGLSRRPRLGWVPAVIFGLVALQVLVQWRPSGSNLFGSSGTNLSFALFLALGFAVTSALAGPAAAIDDSTNGHLTPTP